MKLHAISRTDLGVPVLRGGDTEGAGLGDRFAEELDQRVADARVLDACGREQKLQVASRVDVSSEDPRRLRKSSPPSLTGVSAGDFRSGGISDSPS
jgi:hypothetical protein